MLNAYSYLRFTWHGVGNPPWKTIRMCTGCVNQSTFLGADRETLLFEGAAAERESIHLDANGQPQDVWRLLLVFRERNIKFASAPGQPIVGYGWNHAYCPSSATPGFQRLRDARGATLYPTADFSTLFQLSAQSV